MADPTNYLAADDKISVSIWNHDELSVGSVFGIYNSNEVYGKWLIINATGEVSLPKIGTVLLGGLTREEAEQKLIRLYEEHLVNPVINLRILNREVTVLGQVIKPGNYLLEKDHITLAEVLGRAEGLDFYADQKHVQFIRNVDGTQKEYILDLREVDAVAQNQILVRTGDVIYIPVKKGKTLDKKAPLLIPLSSAVTTAAIILSLFNN